MTIAILFLLIAVAIKGFVTWIPEHHNDRALSWQHNL